MFRIIFLKIKSESKCNFTASLKFNYKSILNLQKLQFLTILTNTQNFQNCDINLNFNQLFLVYLVLFLVKQSSTQTLAHTLAYKKIHGYLISSSTQTLLFNHRSLQGS